LASRKTGACFGQLCGNFALEKPDRRDRQSYHDPSDHSDALNASQQQFGAAQQRVGAEGAH
jgi:hypothetical protein